MNILIIEDEQLAQERLQQIIHAFDPGITIAGYLESVDEAVTWFNTKPHPDLILLDIHLSDGESFEIFKRTHIQKPIIFITAFDNYAIDAFSLFSIDYILKPVTPEALAKAINKYRNISHAFAPANYQLLTEQVKDNYSNTFRTRFLSKVGQRLFFIPTNDVAYFTAENKIVFLVDKEGNRFVINNTMENLERELNPKDFFRLNRKVIIHAEAIDQIKPFHNSRLKLQLKGIPASEEMIISRERVADFKHWADT